jgi:hypothetical protein
LLEGQQPDQELPRAVLGQALLERGAELPAGGAVSETPQRLADDKPSRFSTFKLAGAGPPRARGHLTTMVKSQNLEPLQNSKPELWRPDCCDIEEAIALAVHLTARAEVLLLILNYYLTTDLIFILSLISILLLYNNILLLLLSLSLLLL